MAIKHAFTSPKADGADTTLVRPANWNATYALFPPADIDSITASAPPTISAAQKSQDSTLTGWTTAIAAGDILAFNVDSCATITRVTISIRVTKT